MINNSKSVFTEDQRLAVYCAARRIYSKYPNYKKFKEVVKNIVGGKACFGMCRAMYNAIEEVTDRTQSSCTPDNFPEYFSYKPKTGWKKHQAFWWTISIKNGGRDKRMEVLDRLSKGLSKGE